MKFKYIIVAFLVMCVSFDAYAVGPWVYPVFKTVGPVKKLPDVPFQPEKGMHYKVLFEVAQATPRKGEEKLNPGLIKVARYINTLAVAGIAPENMDIALVVHAEALPLVLRNAVYHRRYGTDNPDRALIDQLRKTGVQLYVCGLNLADRGFKHAWVQDDFQIALSYLVVATTLQLKGYAYIPS